MGPSDDGVAVAPPHLRLLDVSLLHQVVDELLHGPLGDPDRFCHIARAGVRIPGKRDQHVPVVGQEGPLAAIHMKDAT